MSTGQVIGGIVALVVVVIVLTVVVLPLTTMATNASQNREYCQQWSLQIEQQRAVLTGKWFPLDSEWSAFNHQVDQYNQECTS